MCQRRAIHVNADAMGSMLVFQPLCTIASVSFVSCRCSGGPCVGRAAAVVDRCNCTGLQWTVEAVIAAYCDRQASPCQEVVGAVSAAATKWLDGHVRHHWPRRGDTWCGVCWSVCTLFSSANSVCAREERSRSKYVVFYCNPLPLAASGVCRLWLLYEHTPSQQDTRA